MEQLKAAISPSVFSIILRGPEKTNAPHIIRRRLIPRPSKKFVLLRYTAVGSLSSLFKTSREQQPAHDRRRLICVFCELRTDSSVSCTFSRLSVSFDCVCLSFLLLFLFLATITLAFELFRISITALSHTNEAARAFRPKPRQSSIPNRPPRLSLSWRMRIYPLYFRFLSFTTRSRCVHFVASFVPGVEDKSITL